MTVTELYQARRRASAHEGHVISGIQAILLRQVEFLWYLAFNEDMYQTRWISLQREEALRAACWYQSRMNERMTPRTSKASFPNPCAKNVSLLEGTALGPLDASSKIALALKLIRTAQCKEQGKVLDVGHGTGESLILLLTHPSIPHPSHLTGITSIPLHHPRAVQTD
ncbi:hypothetical protein BT96DRAFT_1054317 [Gymnopus androsaceus JB14]|uniref:Methyltransferase domain-containing protein n=1 Tax=Gymnopus androsaceus JB14 TaxID=1447944 RepID=A0A6A4INX5_9AGAR|nr:hypothetical protein BT96DRAFT_1054317 [Gymnopus androsaceus JB14]